MAADYPAIIESLLEQASKAGTDSGDALRFAQAAGHVASIAHTLGSIPKLEANQAQAPGHQVAKHLEELKNIVAEGMAKMAAAFTTPLPDLSDARPEHPPLEEKPADPSEDEPRLEIPNHPAGLSVAGNNVVRTLLARGMMFLDQITKPDCLSVAGCTPEIADKVVAWAKLLLRHDDEPEYDDDDDEPDPERVPEVADGD